MDNLLSEGRKRTQEDPSTSNESSTTAKAQKIAYDSKGREHGKSEDTTQLTIFEGFRRFKVNVANMLTLRDVITLATCLGLATGVVDRLKRSETAFLDVISELEFNGVISCSDISGLLNGLKECNLSGIASKVEYSYQTNVKDHLGSQSQTFQENKDLFISRLKRIYKILYDAVQPLPYVKDRMCCVDKLFIQGNIRRKFIDGRGKTTWKPFESYHEILAQSINGPTRCIILGDPGYGKSTLSLQFLYDWCNNVQQSPLLKVDIVIFLRMRQLGGMTSIYKAIKQLLLPSDSTITSADIEAIIQNTKSTLILFDGYDEYPDRSNDNNDFMKILKMRKLIDTHVILTTRSANVAETPSELKLQSIQFKLTGFTEADQDKYIMKAVVDGDRKAARSIRDKLNENPVLDDMCQIPLFFTIIAHATYDEENITLNTKSVTWFFRFIQECFFKHTSNKQNSVDVASETARPELSKIAFGGLSNKSQQIVWNKQVVVKAVGESQYNNLIRTGILTEDEHIHVSGRVDTKDFFQQLTTTSFYHKLFCESYAAFYLVDIIRSMLGIGSSSSVSDVGPNSAWTDSTDLLSSLDRKDLQYLFRFACGLDDKAGCVIINYLVRETDDTNLAILCIFEFTGEEKDITDAVKILFSRFAKIHGEDSKLLQRAKVGVLQIASRCNPQICLQEVKTRLTSTPARIHSSSTTHSSDKFIPIPDLQLRKSFNYVDGSDIMLRSGLKLPSLSTIEKISINTKCATEDDVIGLLNYGLQSQSFRTIWFFFCNLPEFFNRYRIPTLARTRNVKVLRPNYATQLGLESGCWSEIREIEDIKELCSDTVVIDHTTSKSIQRSVIDLLEKASSNDIPIFRVSLSQTFNVVDGEDIKLHSGLLLPILPSLKGMLILTEGGKELNGNDANGILSHLKCSQRLKEVGFYYCLLPMVLFGSFLQTMRDRKVKVFWSPYGFGKRSYTLDLHEGHWLLGEDHASLFPRKSTGDKLTVGDYNIEVETFRNEWRTNLQ